MNVGLVTHSVSQQSGSRAPVELAAALARSGLETTLYGYTEGRNEETIRYLEQSGVKIRLVRASRRWWSGLAASRELLRLLKADRPDVLSLHARLPFALAAWRSGIPRVQTYYGTQLNALHESFFPWCPWLWPLEWFFNLCIWLYVALELRLATVVVAMNQYTVTEGFRRYGIRMSAIPLGATTPRLRPTGRPGPPHPFTILAISRLTPYKNFHLILEAFRRLLRDVPDARCVIAGIPERPAYLAWLQRHAPPNVEFRLRPSDADLVGLYESCDGYVTADQNLFFGLPVAEAAAFGKPVIAWGFAAAREMVRHDETGYVVSSIAEMAARLGELAADPALRQRLGTTGRERANREFSWERCAKRYAALFETLRKR